MHTPIPTETSSSRKTLLLSASVACLSALEDISPQRIHALGIELAGLQGKLMLFLGVIVTINLLTFGVRSQGLGLGPTAFFVELLMPRFFGIFSLLCLLYVHPVHSPFYTIWCANSNALAAFLEKLFSSLCELSDRPLLLLGVLLLLFLAVSFPRFGVSFALVAAASAFVIYFWFPLTLTIAAIALLILGAMIWRRSGEQRCNS